MSSRSCPAPRGITTLGDGTRRPLLCGRLTCPFCGPATALRTVSAIRLARPTRAGYVSLADEQLATAELRREAPRVLRTAIGRAALDLRRHGRAWEHVSVVELSRSGRPHVHFLQRGDSVAPSTLRKLLRRHGAGWADLSPIRALPVIARYVLKVPISALDLETELAEERLHLHRRLNGGRLATTTRDFWRGVDDEPLAGARAARSAAYRAWARSRQGERAVGPRWSLCTPLGLPRLPSEMGGHVPPAPTP